MYHTGSGLCRRPAEGRGCDLEAWSSKKWVILGVGR